MLQYALWVRSLSKRLSEIDETILKLLMADVREFGLESWALPSSISEIRFCSLCEGWER